MSKPRKVKYNPAFLNDDELIDSFAVRQVDLELVMESIRENDSETNQHVLIVGPRGIGKTTLVLRAAAEIRRDDLLANLWEPIVFPEESYEVTSPGEFWLEALDHLGTQSGRESVRGAHQGLMSEKDDDRLAARALGQLLDYADSIGKRLVLIVENLNMLLGEMLTEDDAWKIRKTLLSEKRIMVLASATHEDDEFRNSRKAMFELFRVQRLKPLSTSECAALWTAVADKPINECNIRPLRILTGGNPRLLAVIASFAAESSFSGLMDDLVALVDDHTEYFKSHLDSLPPFERKVYVALAENWDPCSARRVAELARLDVSKTSALLNRLVDRGRVTTEDKGKKRTYQLAERMFNIYYLMRRRGNSASRVNSVVKFMNAFYDEAGRERLFAKISAMSQRTNPILIGEGENDSSYPESVSEPTREMVGALDPAYLLAESKCNRGHVREALAPAAKWLASRLASHRVLQCANHLFPRLAAGGESRGALTILQAHPDSPSFEPLIVALRQELGEEILVAHEIQEIAGDVRARIAQEKKLIMHPLDHLPAPKPS